MLIPLPLAIGIDENGASLPNSEPIEGRRPTFKQVTQ